MILTLFFVLVSIINGSKKSLFFISSYSEEFGSIYSSQKTVHYSISLKNEDNRKYNIKYIEPIVPSEIKKIVVKHEVLNKEKVTLNKQSKENIRGQFTVDLTQLSQLEIDKLLPMIEQYKIIYDDNKEVILSVYGKNKLK